MFTFRNHFRKKKKILIISGGAFRGVYALGVMKRLEELDMKKDINAVFGVSIGAVIGSLRASGIPAEKIYKEMENVHFSKFYALNFLQSKFKSLISDGPIKKILQGLLPDNIKDIKDTQIPFYVGACDIKTAKFIFFNKGELVPIVLGSMAIPGLYNSVYYKEYELIDGGVVNSFPVNHAKKKYPHHKIIGINLNRITSGSSPKNIFEVLSRTFSITMRSRSYEQNKLVDWLFFRKLDVKLFEFDKKKLKKAFEQGYGDCKKMFG